MHPSVSRTLLLSQGYEPITVISWQRAITLMSLGKVEVVEEHDAEARSVSLVIKLPAVVRLMRAFRRRIEPIKFSRINVFARDGYRCQYCGVRCTVRELTCDHVLPRARGGATTWENIVSCCATCNRDKGSRTPGEARMRLRAEPRRPTWAQTVAIQLSTESMPDTWREYLAWAGATDRD